MSYEEKIKEEIRKKYKLTYPNIIFNLVNKIENMKQEIQELKERQGIR